MTDKVKLTDWYDGSQKPARVGVYQRKDNYGIIYAYWNKHWYIGFTEKENALFWGNQAGKSKYQNDWPWRGIAK